MKNLILLVILLNVSLFIPPIANAGIIDTDSESFIDTQSGLEWMDFGINNIDSYNFVSSNLGSGQKYNGWRVASSEDVTNLLINAFFGFGNTETGNVGGWDIVTHAYNNNSTGSNIEHIFDFMGFNRAVFSSNLFSHNLSRGLFETSSGGLRELILADYPNTLNADIVGISTIPISKLHFKSSDYLGFSTMLIKKVPEPSTVILFMITLFFLLIKKNRSFIYKYE